MNRIVWIRTFLREVEHAGLEANHFCHSLPPSSLLHGLENRDILADQQQRNDPEDPEAAIDHSPVEGNLSNRTCVIQWSRSYHDGKWSCRRTGITDDFGRILKSDESGHLKSEIAKSQIGLSKVRNSFATRRRSIAPPGRACCSTGISSHAFSVRLC